jgi:hypothetical protein
MIARPARAIDSSFSWQAGIRLWKVGSVKRVTSAVRAGVSLFNIRLGEL